MYTPVCVGVVLIGRRPAPARICRKVYIPARVNTYTLFQHSWQARELSLVLDTTLVYHIKHGRNNTLVSASLCIGGAATRPPTASTCGGGSGGGVPRAAVRALERRKGLVRLWVLRFVRVQT